MAVLIENIRERVLKRMSINDDALIGYGMEAHVYKLDDFRVLKIYNDMTTYAKQEALSSFYHNIDATGISIDFPEIYQILEMEGTIVTIEKLINGSNMRTLIYDTKNQCNEKLMRSHLRTLEQMQEVQIQQAFTGIRLFQDEESDNRSEWHDYLLYLLSKQLEKLGLVLSTKIERFNEKTDTLFRVLANKYNGKYTLIHGDFCPENIIVDSNNEVRGVIDFGLMTMQGDYLFDVATGWLFLDMYGQSEFDFRTNYYHLITESLGEEVKEKIALYALLYSIYSIHFYSRDLSDGHSAWCLRNLNDDTLWGNLV